MEIQTILTLITLLGFVITVANFQAGIKKTNEERIRKEEEKAKKDTEHHTEIRTRLNGIEAGVQDMRVDFKQIQNEVSGISERVTRVEESAKSAHKRLDKFEGKCN